MSAKNDVKLLCEAILHFDAKGMKKFKYARKDLYNMWTNYFIQAMKESMPDGFSDDHAKKIGDAMISALKKVEISTNEIAKDKVEITIKGLNVGSIVNNNDLQLDVNPGVKKEEFIDSVIRTVEKNFDALQAGEKKVFVVDCGYYEEEKFWAPLNMDNFLQKIYKGATGEK